MKDYLIDRLRDLPDQTQGRNLVREYLQARILAALQRSGAMTSLAFHGGTALRFLYATPRYSEDLDFALEQHQETYDFRAYLKGIRKELEAEGYQIEIKLNDKKIVHSAFVRFLGLLYELGLSPHQDEILSVKLEIDTNPPPGATLATTIIRRHLPLRLYHHDPATLLAGKLHAILQRSYTKGRDIYDLLWYLSDPNWPEPNLTHLNNALIQSDWSAGELTPENWRDVVTQRLRKLTWDRVKTDVTPFLEREAEVELLTLENLLHILK